MDGCHVVTVEGIGNTKKGLHPVQKELSDRHGSQCGFCTPGFVMSMYSLLRNNATPSAAEVEHSIDGNLCRCTGYRPILDAFKTFCPATEGEQGSKGCCKQVKDGEVPPYASAPEIPFPPQLMPGAFESSDLRLEGDGCTWHRPTTLAGCLALKASHPQAKIVVGNSELEIERKFRSSTWQQLICTTHVPELNTLEEVGGGLRIGASTTLSRITHKLEHLMSDKPPHATQVYKAMLAQLKWFAGTPIRNVAAIGGNVANASPISDLNPVLMACKAIFTLIKVDGSTREIAAKEFFKERMYRQTHLGADELLMSIFVPETRELEFANGYKASRRRDDDIAIVTCGLRMALDKGAQGVVISEAGFAYGGMAASSVCARKTEAFLIGKVLSHETLKAALEVLPDDLPLDASAPGGMIEYRRTMAASFLYKFFLSVMHQATPDLLDAADVSATLDYQRPTSHGLQHYKEAGHKIITDPGGQAVTGPFNVDQGVGKSAKHMAGDLHVTGEANYLDDAPLAGGLYGGVVMSSKSRAKILSVDASAALALEGVHGYFDHKDVQGSNAWGAIIWDEEVFATTDVYTTGAPIGIVVAETHALARKAASLVKVEYEVLDAILTIEEAIAADSFIGDAAVISRGDAVSVLATAKNIVEGEVRIGGQEHFYLETQASLVVPGENDEFTVYASTQNPTKTSNFVAAAIGVPKNKVVCKVKRMGGGFGGKETRSVYLSMALAVAAQKTGKPVRCMLDRDTDMCTAGQRHPFLLKYKVAFSDDGMLLAADCQLFSNGGFSMDLSRPVLDRALFHVENAYNIPNLRVTGRVCRTNLPSNTAFRGFGGPQGIMSAEAYVEHVARALGRPPEEIREKNLYATRGAVTHYKQELVDCHIREMWAQVKETSDFATRRAAVDAFNGCNRWKKRGLAMMPVKFGMSFTAKFMNQASALVHVYTDGTVLVSHGGTEMGQGLHTKMCQIAASELGVPLDKVFISETSTDKCANTHPTAASVGADLNGFAVQDACKQITARLEKYRHKDANMPFKDIAMAAWLDRVDLSAHGFYKTPDLGFDFNTGEGRAFHYHAYGVAACEVEVDVLSGDFQTLRVDILHDVGDSLNPAVDIGQVEGAFVQGLGLFTLEEMVWMKNGQLFTRGPSTYKIPSANDIPIDFRVRLFEDAPNRRTIYSSKGVGEPPLNLAIAVPLAIKDAVASARKDNGLEGPFRIDTPLTVERIRLACGDPILRQYAPTDILAKGSW